MQIPKIQPGSVVRPFVLAGILILTACAEAQSTPASQWSNVPTFLVIALTLIALAAAAKINSAFFSRVKRSISYRTFQVIAVVGITLSLLIIGIFALQLYRSMS